MGMRPGGPSSLSSLVATLALGAAGRQAQQGGAGCQHTSTERRAQHGAQSAPCALGQQLRTKSHGQRRPHSGLGLMQACRSERQRRGRQTGGRGATQHIAHGPAFLRPPPAPAVSSMLCAGSVRGAVPQPVTSRLPVCRLSASVPACLCTPHTAAGTALWRCGLFLTSHRLPLQLRHPLQSRSATQYTAGPRSAAGRGLRSSQAHACTACEQMLRLPLPLLNPAAAAAAAACRCS